MELCKQRSDHSSSLPNFFYSYKHSSNNLYKTNLRTGESYRLKILTEFYYGCAFTELPSKVLIVTGGADWYADNLVGRIDLGREFAFSRMRNMLHKRQEHGALFCAPFIYCIGGFNQSDNKLDQCERFDFIMNSWEAIEPLPQPCIRFSMLEHNRILYVLNPEGSIYQYCLDTLKWTTLALRLPETNMVIGFKYGSKMYFVQNRGLYNFNADTIQLINFHKQPLEGYNSSGSCLYYHRTLFCLSFFGAAKQFKLKVDH